VARLVRETGDREVFRPCERLREVGLNQSFVRRRVELGLDQCGIVPPQPVGKGTLLAQVPSQIAYYLIRPATQVKA